MQSCNQVRSLAKESLFRLVLALTILSSLNMGVLLVLGDSGSKASKSQSVHDEVRAKKFILIDDAGVERGEFGIKADGGAQMIIWSKNKSMFAAVHVGEEDEKGFPLIGIGNSSTGTLAEIGMLDEHSPVFILRDRNETRRIVMMVTPKGVASLYLSGDQGTGGLSMFVNRPGNSGFTMRDEKGNKRASMTVDDSGTSSLYLNNTKDDLGIVLQVDGNDEPDMALFDKDGKPIWSVRTSRVPPNDKAKRP